ncbi:dynamin family protein [Mongoliibacter ruber]|uniref:Dynamin family protein n=2 Tax=Mongoliibacter ruber TaxID=1750599 RepID=A0A2T0WSU0_9BACT|nr:dynamin family protein [Mongoliibacter ruber]
MHTLSCLNSFNALVDRKNLFYQKLLSKGVLEFNVTDLSNRLKELNEIENDLMTSKLKICVVGKTSTGKSEFHNLILNHGNKKGYDLFKTSVKVETSIIQTLQHTNSYPPYANFRIKNNIEFEKIVIPKNVNLIDSKLDLDSEESCYFLRENIIAKKNKSDESFIIDEAVNSIEIFHSLKYFKDYIIVDTPGLGSHISKTDELVKNIPKKSSCIFWLIDASENILGDSLVLLQENKDTIEDKLENVIFFGNKIDLNSSFKKDKDNSEIQENLFETFNSGIKKIFGRGIDQKNFILTAFKNTDGNPFLATTEKELRKLDLRFLNSKKRIIINDISKYLGDLDELLNFSQEIFDDVFSNLEEDIEKMEKETLRNEKKKTSLIDGIDDLSLRIEKDLGKLIKLKILESINNRTKYNKHLDEININLKTIESKISDFINAKLKDEYYQDILELRVELKKGFTLSELNLDIDQENFMKKRLYDGELKRIKVKLAEKIDIKHSEIVKLMKSIIDLKAKIKDKMKALSTYELFEIGELKIKYENTSSYIKEVTNLKNYKKEIWCNFKTEIHKNVINWDPLYNGDEIEKLDNFLGLYSLISELELVEEKID